MHRMRKKTVIPANFQLTYIILAQRIWQRPINNVKKHLRDSYVGGIWPNFFECVSINLNIGQDTVDELATHHRHIQAFIRRFVQLIAFFNFEELLVDNRQKLCKILIKFVEILNWYSQQLGQRSLKTPLIFRKTNRYIHIFGHRFADIICDHTIFIRLKNEWCTNMINYWWTHQWKHFVVIWILEYVSNGKII